MDSTMYFFAGAAVWVKWMPALAVTSSNCGTGREVHFRDLAFCGGGTTGGCPPCARATCAAKQRNSARFHTRPLKIAFTIPPYPMKPKDCRWLAAHWLAGASL